MSPFGNVPPEALADAVEKHVAKMDEGELASLLAKAVPALTGDVRTAMVASIFDAFRERGESSEDAAEGANTALSSLENGDDAALAALLAYARDNTGVLKESMTYFAESHPALVGALPQTLIDGIVAHL